MTANDRTGVGAGSGEWRTPPDLFARLNRRFQFDYDAFASHENALCTFYSTDSGTFFKGGQSWTDNSFLPPIPAPENAPDDGLSFPWTGWRVFMNPPYSRGLIEQCVEKAYNERDNAAIIVALIPAATETRWFQRYVLPHCHIDWLPKRVVFIHPDFECGPKCQTGKRPHKFGEPGVDPPSGMVIATFKTELMP